MNGPSADRRADVTYGSCASAGCVRFHFSLSIASRRSSFHDVTDHTDAATSHSDASRSRALIAHGMPTPEAISVTRGASALSPSGASRNR